MSKSPDAQYVFKIDGNASSEVKKVILETATGFCPDGAGLGGFASVVGHRLLVKEVSYTQKAEESTRMECRITVEITVGDDMANFLGTMHGGCTAYIIDMCTSLALKGFAISENSKMEYVPSVSQALNVVYHSPAMVGDKLRIVNTTIAVGNRTMSAQCEIWNDTQHRQVATGIHTKMLPSPLKLKAQL